MTEVFLYGFDIVAALDRCDRICVTKIVKSRIGLSGVKQFIVEALYYGKLSVSGTPRHGELHQTAEPRSEAHSKVQATDRPGGEHEIQRRGRLLCLRTGQKAEAVPGKRKRRDRDEPLPL